MKSKTQAQLAEQVAAKRAIEILGGPSRAAVVLDVPHHRYQTVQQWILNRVPAEYCPDIERETSIRGEPVKCEEVRSDVDWGVLRTRLTPRRRSGDKRPSKSTAKEA